jgi:hypothetical protein
LITLLSLPTIGSGVLAGANMPVAGAGKLMPLHHAVTIPMPLGW